MAFDQKVTEIKAALGDLVRSLDTADQRVEKFAQEFGQGVQAASSIKDLADAVNRFATATKQINAQGFVEIGNAARQLQQALNAMSTTGPSKVTQAYEQQARVLREVANLQSIVTSRPAGASPYSPAQEIFKARQQTAADLLRARAPTADPTRIQQVAAQFAEGDVDPRVRLGGGNRIRTAELVQQFEAEAAQRSITTPRGVQIDTSLQSYQQQYGAEGAAAALASQEKLAAANARRAAEIESLNNIDADYAAAQKKHTDAIDRAVKAEQEATAAAEAEAQARRSFREQQRAAELAPVQKQYASLNPNTRAFLDARQPDFAQNKDNLLDDKGVARLERQAQLYQQFNAEAKKLSGGKIQLSPEGFNAQSYLDLNNGITKIVGQAQLMDGTFINLNGHVGQNGKLVADLGTRYGSLFDVLGRNITKVAEFALATAAVYGTIRKLGEAFQTIVGVQDELSQISLAIRELGSDSEKFQQRFLNASVAAGARTGQGFEESLQTGLSAFRLTASIPDLGQREQVASRLTELQLGTQSVFGLTKDQSVESIGAIFRQFVDNGVPASEAVDKLSGLLDKFTVAARNSGVVGNDLAQTFAQLSGSADELGVSQDQLVGLTAAYSQVANKSPTETANSLKALTERIYGAGAKDLNDLGIAVREIDSKTGQAKFRDLIDILKDAAAKAQESEASSLQVSQAIGSQRRAPEAAKLIQAVPEIQRITEVTSNVGPGGTSGQFNETLAELRKNFSLATNELSLSFDRFIQKILLDGGLLKDITGIIRGLIDILSGLNKIEDPKIFKTIKEFLLVFAGGSLVAGVASLNFVRNLGRQFLTLATEIREAATAQQQFNTAQQQMKINAAGGVGSVPYGPQPATVPVQPSISPATAARLKEAVAGIGAVALPVYFDLKGDAPDLEKYTSVGARIAGGLVGFMVGGPGGALVGQEIGKAISDSFDVAGKFGTSQAEKEKLGTSAANLSEAQIRNLRGLSSDQLSSIQSALSGSNAYERDVALGRVTTNVLGTAPLQQGQIERAKSKLDFDLSGYGVDPEALRKIAQAAPTATPEEIVNFLKELKDTTSEVSKARAELSATRDEVASHRAENEHGTYGQAKDVPTGVTASIDRTGNLIFETVQDVIDRANAQIASIEGSGKARYQGKVGLAEFGPAGNLEQNLQSRFLSGGLNLQQYQTGIDSLRQIPEIAGQAIPLFQDMGISTDGLLQKLYQLGPTGQQSFQQLIGPLVEAYSVTKEYESLQAVLLELESKRGITVNDAEAKQLEEEITLLQQKLALKQADYSASKNYIASVGPNFQNTLGNFFQVQQKATVIPGTPAQFTPPPLVDVGDYSIDTVRKALDETREKQAELVKLFPQYAKEFAKQQFILDNGAGGFKPVAGINQQFFNQALQQQKQQLQKPDLVDLSKFSDEKVGEILRRATDLQTQAVKLAPDLQQDADKSRLLILRKNNDLLAQNGLSQEFLRIAIDELTKSNEDMLRGHYNLPSDYRAPTIFDYYDNGGKEKGNVNYPPRGGEASLDLAQKIVDAILASQGSSGGKAPDLAALGPTIEPGSRPLGYPNPGSPGKVIPPPSLPGLPTVEATRQATDLYDPRNYDAIENARSKRIRDLGSTAAPTEEKVDTGKLKNLEQAFDRSQKKLDALQEKFDGLGSATGKSAESQRTYVDTVSKLILTGNNAAETFSKLANLAPDAKQLSSSISSAFLQGLRNIPTGAITLNVVINGQPVPAQQAKVTIGTTGTGGQTLANTSTTSSRSRPQ